MPIVDYMDKTFTVDEDGKNTMRRTESLPWCAFFQKLLVSS
jgi:hypothetical protein